MFKNENNKNEMHCSFLLACLFRLIKKRFQCNKVEFPSEQKLIELQII